MACEIEYEYYILEHICEGIGGMNLNCTGYRDLPFLLYSFSSYKIITALIDKLHRKKVFGLLVGLVKSLTVK